MIRSHGNALSLVFAVVTAGCGGAPPARNMISFAELTAFPGEVPDYRIAYGSDSLQFGELRLPRAARRVPVAVLIHGGCWRAAFDVTHASRAASALTKAGFATWTIEYRRIGNSGGGYPGTFTDVASGVDFVRELSRRFPQIDTTRVVFLGHSAGGQLALWAASRRRGESLGGMPVATAPIQPRAVMSLAGIADLETYAKGTGSCSRAVVPLVGGTVEQVAGRFRELSPIGRLPLGVPIRIVHGTADSIVPLAQSRALLARQVASGGVAHMVAVDSAGHFDLIAPDSRAWNSVLESARLSVRLPAGASR